MHTVWGAREAVLALFFFFSSRRRHTRCSRDWSSDVCSSDLHDGAVGSFRDVKLSPVPVQQPLEVWLGGTVPAALERCGRLSDGWLPSLCTPEEAAHGRGVIEDAAAQAGRTISPEHLGVSIGD